MSNATDQSSSHGDTAFDGLERVLDEWRSKIDRLLVQADLASMDVSDDVRSRAEAVENAWLAAKRRLGDIPTDAGSNLGSVRAGVEKLVDDVRQAYLSAEAAVRRSRATK
ncbi:MAG TPA: hypothetical protein VIH95_10765 [Acidimicrobiales bacterium]